MPKKTDAQALQWMRDVCLALPNTSETLHYGEIVFKVGSKLFASCGAKKGAREIVFRIAPDATETLLVADSRFTRYPFEKSALRIKASDVDDWNAMRGFVEESYRREASPPPLTKPSAAGRPAAEKSAAKKLAAAKPAAKKSAAKKPAPKRAR